jgi:hypothetical protein
MRRVIIVMMSALTASGYSSFQSYTHGLQVINEFQMYKWKAQREQKVHVSDTIYIIIGVHFEMDDRARICIVISCFKGSVNKSNGK